MNSTLLRPLDLTARLQKNKQTVLKDTNEYLINQIQNIPEYGKFYKTHNLVYSISRWHDKKKKRGVGVGGGATIN